MKEDIKQIIAADNAECSVSIDSEEAVVLPDGSSDDLKDMLLEMANEYNDGIEGYISKKSFYNTKLWFIIALSAIVINIAMLGVIAWQRAYIKELVDDAVLKANIEAPAEDLLTE